MNLSEQFQLDITALAGQRFAVIGKSGSGKTNTLGVFAEEWMNAGLPLTVIDPMFQFGALPGAIKAGRRKDADIEIHMGNAADLAKLSLKERVSVLLDMSLYKDSEALDILSVYLSALWDTLFTLERPQPYALVIDEAHMFAPQQGKTILSELIIDMAKRGRHKNLTTVIATQRAASIVKDFLTQATLLIAHRLTFGVDTAILREQLPLPEKELNGMMRKLATGEALVLGDPGLIGDDDYRRVQIRKRLYADDAPDPIAIEGTSRTLDSAIKQALAKLAEKPILTTRPDMESVLRQELETVQAELATAQETIKQLEAALRQAQRINIKLPDKMDVKRVDVGSLVVANGHPITPDVQQGKVADLLIVDDPDEEPYRSPLSLTRAINRQQRQFEQLRRGFQMLSPYLQDTLLVLHESGEPMDAHALARKVGCSPGSISSNSAKVSRLGLIERAKGQYRSVMVQALNEQFPDLNTQELIDQLLQEEVAV